jgi:hypothetical protein
MKSNKYGDYKMKQKLLRVIILMMFQGLFFGSVAMAIPLASLNLTNLPAGIGDTFQVEVSANGDGFGLDLLSFGFDVTFDQGGVFDFSGYTLGTGFDDDSFGSGNVAGSAFPGIANNEVLLATLSFTVIASGTDSLHVIGLYDGMFSGLYYELDDGGLIGYDINDSLNITVGGASTPVPEPSIMLLFGTGIAGLAAVRRRQRR